MQELRKGLYKLERSCIYNALVTLMVYVFAVILTVLTLIDPNSLTPDKITTPILIFIGITFITWFAFIPVLIISVYYQYSGAIALLASVRKEKPPSGGLIRIGAWLIIIDPLLNIPSLTGTIMVSYPFARGKKKPGAWKIYVPLFVIGTVGFYAGFIPIGPMLDIENLFASFMVSILFPGIFVAMLVGGYYLLYVSLKEIIRSVPEDQ